MATCFKIVSGVFTLIKPENTSEGLFQNVIIWNSRPCLQKCPLTVFFLISNHQLNALIEGTSRLPQNLFFLFSRYIHFSHFTESSKKIVYYSMMWGHLRFFWKASEVWKNFKNNLWTTFKKPVHKRRKKTSLCLQPS